MYHGTLGSRDGETRVIYKTVQTYEVTGTTTCGALCDEFRLDPDKDGGTTLFITSDKDYPLRVSTQWRWLAKQQPSRLVTLLRAINTESFYDQSTTASTDMDR